MKLLDGIEEFFRKLILALALIGLAVVVLHFVQKFW